LDLLASYFENRGFKAYSHVRLNVSWGNIISDVDLVIMDENKMLGVEVKSRKDQFRNAFQQTGKLCDFFDGVYIASDKPERVIERNWQDKRIGLLLIENGKITEKECKPLLTKPRHSALVMLRKICLLRLAKAIDNNIGGNKNKLAFDILVATKSEPLRLVLKSIVTCERKCESACPIWDLEKKLIMPLRNIQDVLRKYGVSKDIPAPLIPADTAEEKDDHD
jgi:hypothetical protein